MTKKNQWSLVSAGDDGLEPGSPGVPVPGSSRETKEVHRKWVANTAEEVAKADETWRAGELIDALNDQTTQAGVETIERNVALSNQPRDPTGQKLVDKYLERRTSKQLEQRERITDIGIKEIELVVDRELTPDPEPPKKKGFFDW